MRKLNRFGNFGMLKVETIVFEYFTLESISSIYIICKFVLPGSLQDI